MVADSVTLFQIKRIGKKITMEYKDPDNDTEWVAIDRPVVEFSGELQVGVTAANTGSEAFTVKFEGLKFEEK
jgi:regulation of enolase protein 1 (concanavalin A-like superfamily)